MTFNFVPSDEVTRIRARLDHPVIDGDGHLLEFLPLVNDIVREIAGNDVGDRYQQFMRRALAPDDAGFMPARVFWGLPEEHTLDRMTVTLPALTYRRAEELGLDFLLLYPSFGLTILAVPDAEVRQAVTRALNTYYAEMYGDYRDRLEPVAVIPTFTPEEAVAELDYAIGTLGLKAVVMNGVIPRATLPDGTPHAWVDTLGHGSLYDYDPLWARCAELGVAPSFHGVGYGWGSRVSATELRAQPPRELRGRAGGCVSFPRDGWGPAPFPRAALRVSRGRRGLGRPALRRSPGSLREAQHRRGRDVRPPPLRPRRVRASCSTSSPPAGSPIDAVGTRRNAAKAKAAPPHDTLGFDDFAEALLTDPTQIVDIFTRQFSFGCEADDPLNALAFDRKLLPHGARLNAMFASDIGHWDVPDMREVLVEAWELVDDGLLDEDEFRDFTCGNVVKMLTASNPDFFTGTAVADAVRPFVSAR